MNSSPGNLTVARLLVRQMIPAAAPGSSMEDIVTARFDYDELDRNKDPVRLRLNSTVVNVQHQGSAASAKGVEVSYVSGGKSYRVKGRHCVLACYNAMIPWLCPDLREALANQVKSPILYTSVALTNWRAWAELGVGGYTAPDAYHVVTMLDFPVSLGDYRFSANPDEPIIAHMERFPQQPNSGLDPKTQYRMGRIELLTTPFADIERRIRTELAGALGEGGFDPARDIAGITVNRWAHGYSYFYNGIDDPWYPDRDDERYPHVRARKPFGSITIANSDAGARAMLESAVVQAWRAVSELG